MCIYIYIFWKNKAALMIKAAFRAHRYHVAHLHTLYNIEINMAGKARSSIFESHPKRTDARISHISKTEVAKWGFPEIGVSPKHPLIAGTFHYKSSSYGGLWKPPNVPYFFGKLASHHLQHLLETRHPRGDHCQSVVGFPVNGSRNVSNLAMGPGNQP